jgi:hypothetical protein
MARHETDFADEPLRVWPGTPGPSLKAGATAGLLGGIGMLLWTVGRAELGGSDWAAPLRLLGAPLMRRFPLEPGSVVALVEGPVMHLLVAAILGMVFAAILPYSRSAGLTLMLAVGYALLVMVVMTVAVLPVVNPALRSQVSSMAGSWLAEHLIFGLSLALVPFLRTRFSEPV